MFKRVEKRRKRQEEEEELGLDEDAKEVLGLNDTDSDESRIQIRTRSLRAQRTAKVLKALERRTETRMKIRTAHQRRWKQFTEFAKSSNAAPDSNAWDVLKARAEAQPKLSLAEGSTVSKRNKKREEQKAKIAARREKKREAQLKRKAKKAAVADGGAEPEGAPPQKKRKVEDAPNDETAPSPTKPFKKAARSPRTDRLERQGKLHAKLTPHEPPGGRGKGNGKKKLKGTGAPSGRGKTGGEKGGKWKDERGKRGKKDGANDRHKPLEIFD
ncbi:hypothetical protein MVEN_02119500 [Mycena venus]|uniref:Uncharacterized protein n=1 Tax=Mycena venus TaxID=2733690 RepID=A0A8H7CGI2_9AGAR|nr:hypothetical protein MVEN_02119500 [Mycena venus]